MSPGQTGHITGQMGRVPGTDGTHTRGCPAKILYVYWFFSFPSTGGVAQLRSSRITAWHIADTTLDTETIARRDNMSNGIFMRTRRKQRCATFVRKRAEYGFGEYGFKNRAQ